MVKVNGVKVSKGKKRKLVGTHNSNWVTESWRHGYLYTWREL